MGDIDICVWGQILERLRALNKFIPTSAHVGFAKKKIYDTHFNIDQNVDTCILF